MKKKLVFGEDRICKRCGSLCKDEYRFSAGIGAQGNALFIVYCENCKPGSTIEMLFDFAMAGQQQEAEAAE